MKTEIMQPDGPDRRRLTAADRAAAKAAREVVAEVRLAGLEVDGAFALAEHIMGGVRDLDDARRSESCGDAVLSVVLAEIEATAIRQAKNVQRNLFTQW